MPASAARLSQCADFDDVLRDAFALAQHDAVGVGAIVLAGIGGPQEQLRGLGEVWLPAVARIERHHAEVIERGGVVLRGGALELLLGAVAVLRHAIGALEQQDAEFVGRLRISQIARQTIPAGSLKVAAADRGSVVIDSADQRHRRRVLGVVVEAALRLFERKQEVAALIGAEGEVWRLSVRPRRQSRRRRRGAPGDAGPQGGDCWRRGRVRRGRVLSRASPNQRQGECKDECEPCHRASAAISMSSACAWRAASTGEDAFQIAVSNATKSAPARASRPAASIDSA